ncbi:MAG: hypothetical protein EPO11_10510, partial [Gammaproteobacteria bacterium]
MSQPKKLTALASFFILSGFFPSLSQAVVPATSCLVNPTLTTTPTVSNIPIRTYNVCGVNVSAYIDGSYNHLSRSDLFVSGVQDRVFDIEQNGPTFQQADLILAKQPSAGLGGLTDILIGRDSNLFAPYGWATITNSQQIAGTVLQAYLQYAIGSFTFIAGKFSSWAGAEYAYPAQDMNYSRAILYGYAEPGTFIGARGTYAFSDKLSFIAGLNNGWDNVRDYSRRKTIELAVLYTPSPKYSFVLDGYSGGERYVPRVSTGPMGIRNLIDFVANYNVTDKLTLAANYDHDTQTKALNSYGNIGSVTWQGLAAYIGYKFNDTWRGALRGEI